MQSRSRIGFMLSCSHFCIHCIHGSAPYSCGNGGFTRAELTEDDDDEDDDDDSARRRLDLQRWIELVERTEVGLGGLVVQEVALVAPSAHAAELVHESIDWNVLVTLFFQNAHHSRKQLIDLVRFSDLVLIIFDRDLKLFCSNCKHSKEE